MATFNGERFLAEQLESLETQTRRPDELVIVDDASTDGTVAILREFADRHRGRVRLRLSKENRGADLTFAEALGHCTADLVFPCDQDDRWHPEKIERIAREVEERADLGLVASDSSLIGEHGEEIEASFWRRMGVADWEVRSCNGGEAFRVLIRHPFVSGHAMAIRRQLLSRAFPVPSAWTYDEWLNVFTTAQAPALLLRECLSSHRLHSRQTVGHSRESLRAKLRGHDRRRERFAFDRQVDRADALVDRLTELAKLSVLEPKVESVARERRRFVRARRRMRDSGLARQLLLIAREMASGRYWRVGRGVLALARDLSLLQETVLRRETAA